MATCTYILRLKSLAKKVESLIQSLQCATIQPSEDQYQSLRALGARLSKAAANVPSEIDNLHERHAAALEEGKKLISQAQSDRRDVIDSGQLKNRSVFGRNIVLFFEGPKDSVIDSKTTKARKELTRDRCQRISSLSPDGLISWAAAFMPTTWIANQMSGGLYDYLLENIEPDEAQVWPSEIHNIVDSLGAEEPLRGSHKYQEFLKGKSTFSENSSMKINESLAFKDGANASSPMQTKKRKRVEDRLTLGTKNLSMVPVAQMGMRKIETFHYVQCTTNDIYSRNRICILTCTNRKATALDKLYRQSSDEQQAICRGKGKARATYRVYNCVHSTKEAGWQHQHSNWVASLPRCAIRSRPYWS